MQSTPTCSGPAKRPRLDLKRASAKQTALGQLPGLHAFYQDDDAALPLLHDDLGGETVEGALTGALIDALDALSVQYGSADPAACLQPIAQTEWGASRTPFG